MWYAARVRMNRMNKSHIINYFKNGTGPSRFDKYKNSFWHSGIKYKVY